MVSREEFFVEKIRSEIEKEGIEEGLYKLTSTHFENGFNLHSAQYYYAKKYFQKTENSGALSELLVSKLRKFVLPENTTLVGFRNYIGLLLNKTINALGKYNYEIIEQIGSEFVWQSPPKLEREEKQNLLIVLPITCTCSTYLKLTDFIRDFLIEERRYNNVTIDDRFINVFVILQNSLRELENDTVLISDSEESGSARIYSTFNWRKIEKERITFSDNKNSDPYYAYPLVRLYSELYPPETCPLCFPKSSITDEKPVIPTHDNFETPNLIFGFPNFSSESSDQPQDFFKRLGSRNAHLYGHVDVSGISYMHFIRGNAFYENNKPQILKFFNKKLGDYLNSSEGGKGEKDRKIIFITAENKHNSRFLEDISACDALKGIPVTILRFLPSNEFVDNFISLHSRDIKTQNENLKVIYFEDVLSFGKTFKLISNYIKHSRDDEPYVTDKRGFDLLLTLVDRTPPYTKAEIFQKLSSRTNKNPKESFMAFFRLNVPIVAASHLENPMARRIADLEKMLEQCHLDSLKNTTAKKIQDQQPRKLPEIDRSSQRERALNYFPFGNIEREINRELYDLYKPHLNRESYDLLKLYLAHEINSELSEDRYKDFFARTEGNPGTFITELLRNLNNRVRDNLGAYFINRDMQASPYRNIEAEQEIVHETIVKILSRHPFTYYKNIYEAIFQYCVNEIDKLHDGLERGQIREFRVFRRLLYFIGRCVELNSNFILSRRFLYPLKTQYNRDRIERIVERYRKIEGRLKESHDRGEIEKDYYDAACRNLRYKLDHVTTYFSYLLYCYKQLFFRNPHRSIKLEGLINSPELLPDEINTSDDPRHSLREFISNPYFQFTGMVKAENIFLLNELKELHKKNVIRVLKSDDLEQPVNFMDPDSIRQYYFVDENNDSVILNARKLLNNSRFKLKSDEEGYQNVLTAVSMMLRTVGVLEHKKRKKADREPGKSLQKDIKDILDSLIQIIQPGMAENSLKFAFFVEYRKRTSNSSNIYSMVSDGSLVEPSIANLSMDGLVYNMLYGLYDNPETRNVQSLIAAVRSGDEMCSFQSSYFLESPENGELTERGFADLYEHDLFDPQRGEGLEILEDSNMSLFFRLSNLVRPENPGDKYKLVGEAVIVIATTEESNVENFLNFMSNEKIRLLLLIKEELLQYLRKQLEGDAFIEAFENQKAAAYQSLLRHGLIDYIDALNYLIDDQTSDDETPSSEDTERYDIADVITTAMKAQLQAIAISRAEDSELTYTREDVLRKICLIFKTSKLGNTSVDINDVNLDDFDFESIKINRLVFEVIVPEIIINMKTYSPRDEPRELLIAYNRETQTFTFENNVVRSPFITVPDEKSGGFAMCINIMRELGFPEIGKRFDKNRWHVNLSLKKS